MNLVCPQIHVSFLQAILTYIQSREKVITSNIFQQQLTYLLGSTILNAGCTEVDLANCHGSGTEADICCSWASSLEYLYSIIKKTNTIRSLAMHGT